MGDSITCITFVLPLDRETRVEENLPKAGRSCKLIILLLLAVGGLWAYAAGSVSGVVKDPTGAAIPGARFTLINTALKSEFKVISDANGFYSFPAVPVGRYDLTIEATGFQTQKKTNLGMDTDAGLRIDAALELVQQFDTVTV